ncbi:MAG: phosphoribosylanthranilate isomerase [Clostridium sp.]|nr:phosphoribosylanthranilate isomerase [Clostridium sp.]
MEPCKIKICGLSRFADIMAVNEARPDYAGFVFADSSRRVTPDKARQLKKELAPGIRAVGVFVNANIHEIRRLAGEGSSPVIDVIQLHGDEDEAYIRRLKAYTDLPVIKAVRAKSREQILEAAKLPCEFLLLDTYTKGQYGGSGRSFDWNLIPRLEKPYFLAGGIRQENLEAAASRRPYCIDVSSAVETEGRKDGRKILEMVQALQKLNLQYSRTEKPAGD